MLCHVRRLPPCMNVSLLSVERLLSSTISLSFTDAGAYVTSNVDGITGGPNFISDNEKSACLDPLPMQSRFSVPNPRRT